VDRLLGHRSTIDACAYASAQLVGACAGAVLANVMFDLSPVTWSTHTRDSSGMWLAEFVATLGLVTVILSVVRAGQLLPIAVAVGAYISAAYWFTSSTSFANPAVTVGRTLTNTFAGIRPSSVPGFVLAQMVAGLVAVALVRLRSPAP
jgi:glycerol uptake facilitator-like aquaporin